MQKQQKQSKQRILQPRKIRFLDCIRSSMLKKIYACSNRSYAIFQDFIISWGEGIFWAQNQEGSKTVQQIQRKFSVIPIKVDSLALGTHHTFAYSKSTSEAENQKGQDGNVDSCSVYCWGSNRNYQLGLQDQKCYGLVKVDLFDEAFQAGFILNQISCGDNHTLAVFEDEQTGQTKVFGWGQSKSYQLALDTTGIVPYPVNIQFQLACQVHKIESKSDYNIAILNNGDIYSWGSNMFNRLGLSQSKNKKSPMNTNKQLFNGSKGPSNQDSSITDRRFNNVDNQTTNIQKVKIPRKIQIFDRKIKWLALGTYHAVAISTQGQCFSWGNGIYGQLGNNKFGECSPQKIVTQHLLHQVIFVSCCAGQQHSCILDAQGNVYTCGSNSNGVLGHKKHQNQTKKKRCKIFQKVDYFQVSSIKVKRIVSGNRHILIQTQDNEVFGWGSNHNRQICFQTDQASFQKYKYPPEKAQNRDENKRGKSDILAHKQIQTFQMPQIEVQQPRKTRDIKDSLQNNKFSQNLLGNYQNHFQQDVKKELIQNNYLNQLDTIPLNKSNITPIEQIKDWKSRYTKFLTKKREQENEYINQLDEIFQITSKNN